MEDIVSFILAGFALTGSPGPATLGLAAAGAAYGIRRSMPLMIGATIGVVAVMLMTASGLTGLVLAQPMLGPTVTALAAAYMIYLAYRIATAPPPNAQSGHESPPGFIPGLFLGIGNPKAYAAMVALFSGFTLVRNQLVIDVAAKTGALIVIVIIVDIAWIMLGSVLTHAFQEPRIGRALNIVFAALLLVSVLLAFVV